MAIAVILFFTPPPQLRIPFLACFHQLRGFFHTRPSVAGLRFGTPLLAVSLPSGTPYRLRGFFSRPPISCGSPLPHTSTGCQSSFGHNLPAADFLSHPPISCGSPLPHTSTGCQSSFGHNLPAAGFLHAHPSVAGLRLGTPLLAVSLPSGTPCRLRGFFVCLQYVKTP